MWGAIIVCGERSLYVGSIHCLLGAVIVCVPTDTVCLSHPHHQQPREGIDHCLLGAIIVCEERSLSVGSSHCVLPTDTVCLSHPHRQQLREGSDHCL